MCGVLFALLFTPPSPLFTLVCGQDISEARGLGAGPWTEDCESPPFHDAFSTPLQMMDFVKELRELSAGKPIGFKMCVGNPVEFAALIHAMIKKDVYPDFITIDGAEGGTGAAPPGEANEASPTNSVHKEGGP